ncbi:hypothetical protein BM525_20435 (plasmid) [Alteromonas mediterranea]|uniref:HigA2-like helix-turn-helix domain-containing protein n=1 Tax=Alteromonas mediterranea TaxID=314275 RepID=A0AAC9JI28_9ALTE|nr:XRE family transcriptional regulator [Alteromonas mediterranea]APD92248.1 hypothetical protein BM524_20240 [Alteromonas mediterranea]APE00103.1 hypothetical protein BM525_20435 [Alteromonas mediterranea]
MKIEQNKPLTLSEIKELSGEHVKQAIIAYHMSVQEPAVSKLERKRMTSLQLSKIQRYMTAIGATLEIKVTLRDGTVLGEDVFK